MTVLSQVLSFIHGWSEKEFSDSCRRSITTITTAILGYGMFWGIAGQRKIHEEQFSNDPYSTYDCQVSLQSSPLSNQSLLEFGLLHATDTVNKSH